MQLRARVTRLEGKRAPAQLSLVFLTPQGLQDVRGRTVTPEEAAGAKVVVGIDPRNL